MEKGQFVPFGSCLIFSYIFIANLKMYLIHRLSFLFGLVNIIGYPADLRAQHVHNQADSLLVFSWLEKADEFDLTGRLDSAAHYTYKARDWSRQKKYLSGEGYALLKAADLLLKMSGTDSVHNLCQEGIRIGERLRDSLMIGLGHHQLGQYYRDKTQYDQAIASFLNASVYYEKIRNINYLALTYNDISYIFERQGAYESAVSFNLKAIQLFELLKNIKELANSKGNLGVVYYRMNKKETAIQLFKESALLREQIKDSKGLAAIYGNLATAYGALSLDSATHYQKLALIHATKTGVKANIAQANTNTAMLLARQKKFKEALEYEEVAIRLYSEIGDRTKVANRHISTALANKALGDSISAETHFRLAEGIAQELNIKPILQNLYLQKFLFYRDYKNFQMALQHNELYQQYKDSLLNEKTIANIAELQTKYETEKKDFEIARLTADQKLKQLTIRNQEISLKSALLEQEQNKNQILILEQEQKLTASLNAQQQMDLQRKARESAMQQELLEKENLLAESRINREKWLRNFMLIGLFTLLLFAWFLFNRYQLRQRILAQERMLAVRNAISKDLHDEVGSTLTSINVLSKAGQLAVNQKPEITKELLARINDQSKSVQQNISDIVWSIRPDTAKVEFLVSRIREFAALTLEPENIAVQINADEEMMQGTLDEFRKKEILLILKEAINNIIRHAHASHVEINCRQQSNSLLFSITDDGVWKNNSNSTGTGMNSMKERAAKMHGNMQIERLTKGTRVSLSLPLRHTAKENY